MALPIKSDSEAQFYKRIEALEPIRYPTISSPIRSHA